MWQSVATGWGGGGTRWAVGPGCSWSLESAAVRDGSEKMRSFCKSPKVRYPVGNKWQDRNQHP